MRPLRVATPAALVLALLAVAPAQADQQIVAAPVDRFVNPDVTIAPGERLTFASQDIVAPHNVTAKDNNPDGTPLFASATIGNGDVAPVVGADKLGPGTYGFFCTIHPLQMNGTLNVSGDPVARDTVRPTLSARVDSGSLRALEQRKTMLATVTSDEVVTGKLTARAFGVTLARRTVSVGAGATAVVLKLTSKGLRGVRKRSRANVGLTFTATDGAGNTGSATAKRTLRRT